jgi:hypothetical protein
MRSRQIAAMLGAIIASGCALGPRTPLPCQQHPGEAASVTVYRQWSVVGAPATMFFVINRNRVYGLAMGQSYSFRLDPGLYSMGYDLGFNECRQRIWLEPNQSYRIEMLPGCNLNVENLTNPCDMREWR